MTFPLQRTIERETSHSGVGLHSGCTVNLVLKPATEGGITFRRTDLPGAPELPAHANQVSATAMATVLGPPNAGIGTIEHLCAALVGLGIDNVKVEVDGPELPIMDGSALPFVALLRSAGLRELPTTKPLMVIRKEVRVTDGEKHLTVAPAPDYRLCCEIDFPHPAIGRQSFALALSEEAFERDVAPARTFGFSRDLEALKARGQALGGSLENAILLDEQGVVNPNGLRFSDEFARHKLLDALGDLSLLGVPLRGEVRAHKSGHALNHALVTRLLAEPDAYELVPARSSLSL